MTGAYDVDINWVKPDQEPTRLADQAVFNSAFNQTIYEGWNPTMSDDKKFQIPLWQVASIVFSPGDTKSAPAA